MLVLNEQLMAFFFVSPVEKEVRVSFDRVSHPEEE